MGGPEKRGWVGGLLSMLKQTYLEIPLMPQAQVFDHSEAKE